MGGDYASRSDKRTSGHLWGSARGASSSDFKAAAVRKEVGELGNALNGKPIGRRCWPAIAGVVAPPAAHVGCPARNRGKSSSPTTQANSFPPLQLGQGTFPSISMADECTSACFAQCHQRDARRRVAGGSAENPPDGGFIRPAGFVRRNAQPRVEYCLSEIGESLRPVIDALREDEI